MGEDFPATYKVRQEQVHGRGDKFYREMLGILDAQSPELVCK